MIELALLIPTLILGYLLWRADRRYDRDTDIAQKLLTSTLDEWSEDRDKLLKQASEDRKTLEAEHIKQRDEWLQERSQLLNRIQRPDMAVYENFEPSSLKQHVSFDDDEAFWDAVTTDGDS